MANELITPKDLHSYLAQRREHFTPFFPNPKEATRLLKTACMALMKDPYLSKCSPASIFLACMQAAQFGFEIGIDAHIVAYGKTAQLLPDYKGKIQLAYEHERISRVEAHCVYSNDEFNYSHGMKPELEHYPEKKERGELTDVYAICFFKDGTNIFVVLDRETVMKHKAMSKAPEKAWRDWEPEMWKKTAIHQLWKYMPRTLKMKQAQALEDAADTGEVPLVGVEGEEIFDADFDVIPDDEKPKKTKGKKVKEALESGEEHYRVDIYSTNKTLQQFLTVDLGAKKCEKEGVYCFDGLSNEEAQNYSKDMVLMLDPVNQEEKAYKTGALRFRVIKVVGGKDQILKDSKDYKENEEMEAAK